MSGPQPGTERDGKTGRFLPGNTGFGGRPRGARSKLGEAFLEDLRDAWMTQGATALRRCAEEEPAQFCKIVASLMPKDFNVNVDLDAAQFATDFRRAVAMLGNEPLAAARPMQVITNGRQR